MLPDRMGRRGVIGGEILRPLACGNDLEAGGAGPVNHLGNERRLVTIGERVDDARLGRPPRERWPGKRVRLHIQDAEVLRLPLDCKASVNRSEIVYSRVYKLASGALASSGSGAPTCVALSP